MREEAPPGKAVSFMGQVPWKRETYTLSGRVFLLLFVLAYFCFVLSECRDFYALGVSVDVLLVIM